MVNRLSVLGVCLMLVLPAGADIDHGLLSRALARHVSGGQVDYPAFQTDADFTAYLALLPAVQAADLATDVQRKAFYLNAYNACVIKGVVDHWPVTQVVKVPGFLDRLKYKLAGRELTLDQVENDILRPMGDPRIHAALVNGARSAPQLRAEAYLPAKLDEQLDDQARRWVNDTSRNRVERAAGKLVLSKIFDWYRPDFESVGGAAGFMKQYIANPDLRAWLGGGDYQIEYMRFDWGLNSK